MKARSATRRVSILLRLWLNCVVYFERENYLNIWRFGAKNHRWKRTCGLCLSGWGTLLKVSSFTSHGVFSNTGCPSSWVNTLLCLNTRRKHRKIPSLTEYTFHGLMPRWFLHVLSAIFNTWFKGNFLLLVFMRHFIILIAENSTFYTCVLCASLFQNTIIFHWSLHVFPQWHSLDHMCKDLIKELARCFAIFT